MITQPNVPEAVADLDGVVEIVLGQIHVDTADTDWATQLRAVAHDVRRLGSGAGGLCGGGVMNPRRDRMRQIVEIAGTLATARSRARLVGDGGAPPS